MCKCANGGGLQKRPSSIAQPINYSTNTTNTTNTPNTPTFALLINIIMGRGDKKTKKGKIFKGSFGKSRPAGPKKITGNVKAEKKA